MTKLTALVITYNEVIHIDDLINNLDFADECIVIDSFSNDGTYERLTSYKHVQVHQRTFKNFADQKNHALGLASHDWVLFIDADERISEAFKSDVLEKINMTENPIVAYLSRFKYYFGETPIHYSGFQTAKSYRLFRKSKCSYDRSKIVHEDLIVDGDSGYLKHHILHYSFRDYQHYHQKMTHYAHLKAKILHQKGKKVNFLKVWFKPLYRFFNHYIIRLGILDGKIGYDISKLNAYEIRERYRELERLNRSSILE